MFLLFFIRSIHTHVTHRSHIEDKIDSRCLGCFWWKSQNWRKVHASGRLRRCCQLFFLCFQLDMLFLCLFDSLRFFLHRSWSLFGRSWLGLYFLGGRCRFGFHLKQSSQSHIKLEPVRKERPSQELNIAGGDIRLLDSLSLVNLDSWAFLVGKEVDYFDSEILGSRCALARLGGSIRLSRVHLRDYVCNLFFDTRETAHLLVWV